MKNVYIVAGEPSGDLLAANLAKEILAAAPNSKICGVGGLHMRAACVAVEEDMSPLSLVGVTEAIKRLPTILSLLRRIKLRLLQHRPDVLVLIDAPAFNLRLAKWARRLGFKIHYVVSPQVWAWKKGRIKTIRHVVDHMTVLLPFETDLYAKHKIPNFLLQHPLFAIAQQDVDKQQIFADYSLDAEKPILILMPGSRIGELTRHLPLLQQFCLHCKRALPQLQIVCLRAPHLDLHLYEVSLDKDVTIVTNHNHEMLSVATAAIVASGTATLEVALHQVPMVVFYKTSGLTYALARVFVKVSFIALCNWVLGKKVVPELVQGQATVANLEHAIVPLLSDTVERQNMCAELKKVTDKFLSAQEMRDLAKAIVN